MSNVMRDLHRVQANARAAAAFGAGLLMVGALSATPAAANIVEGQFTAQITSITDTNASLSGLASGQSFTGTFSYDTANVAFSQPNLFSFDHPFGTFSANFAPFSFSSLEGIQIAPFSDLFGVEAGGIAPSTSGGLPGLSSGNGVLFHLELTPTGNTFDNGDLPLTLTPDLFSGGSGYLCAATALQCNQAHGDLSGANILYGFQFDITDLEFTTTVTPPPPPPPPPPNLLGGSVLGNFSATVSEIVVPNANFGGLLTGQQVTGSFQYDPNNISLSQPNLFTFDHPFGTLNANLGPYCFVSDEGIQVAPFSDVLGVEAGAIAPLAQDCLQGLIPDHAGVLFHLGLTPAGSTFDNGDLPLVLSSDLFSGGDGFFCVATGLQCNQFDQNPDDPNILYAFRFTVDDTEFPVSEPHPLMLLACSLALVGWRRASGGRRR